MPELKNIDAFHEALDNYQLSSSAIDILENIKLVVLTGLSASGRNTIINELLRTNEYNFIVSDTTRSPRVNNGILEQDGREYFFRSEEDMLADIKNGNFLEAEVIHEQQVSGISMRELQKASKQRRVAIADTDIGGVHNILRLKPDTVAVLVLPPTLQVWQERIFKRGEMDATEYRRRLQTAKRILTLGIHEKNELKIVINDDLTDAVEEIDQLVQTNSFSNSQQEKGITVARELLRATELALAELN